MENKLEPRKLYTSRQVINKHGKNGLRVFQDLKASCRIDWVQDDTFGNKLYRLNQ